MLPAPPPTDSAPPPQAAPQHHPEYAVSLPRRQSSTPLAARSLSKERKSSLLLSTPCALFAQNAGVYPPNYSHIGNRDLRPQVFGLLFAGRRTPAAGHSSNRPFGDFLLQRFHQFRQRTRTQIALRAVPQTHRPRLSFL